MTSSLMINPPSIASIPLLQLRITLHGLQDGTQSNLLFQQNYHGTNDAQTINSKNAAALDKDLMSVGAFSLDQLMELAGLSVSQAGELFGVGWQRVVI